MKISFLGTELQSPFIIGSGPFSYSGERMAALHRAGAGAVVTKTISLKAANNPEPHIASAGAGSFINSEQWSDYSGEEWVRREIPAALTAGVCVIASLGHQVEDVDELLPSLDRLGVPFFELVSYDESTMLPMLKRALALTDKPVLVKVSPNWQDPVSSALTCLKEGAAGITAIDSLGPVLVLDIKTGRPAVGGHGGSGWLTGRALRPLAQRIVADIASATDAPVVGLGGIMQPSDAVEMAMAGASALGICSFLMEKGIDALPGLISGMDALCEELGYGCYDEVKGFALSFLEKEQDRECRRLEIQDKACRFCGICIKRCPYGALTGDQGIISVDRKLCRRCGLCVSSCPSGHLKLGGNGYV